MRWMKGLVRAYDPFSWFMPHPFKILKPRYAKPALAVYHTILDSAAILSGRQDLAGLLGRRIGMVGLQPLTRRMRTGMHKSLMMAQVQSRRTLLDPVIQEIERDRDGRIVRRMRVMYHDANKAKKHLDVHIGRTSLIYRITGKPVEEKIRFNRNGELTQESKDALIAHLRAEVGMNARVAQNLDHSITNAKCSWMAGETGIYGYGSGLTRQMVAECDVEFYHHQVRTSEHVYCPLISGVQATYLYQIYPGNDVRDTPILIWGKLNPITLKFKDRLHLTLIQPEELDKFQGRIDVRTNSRKYDGASTHFHSNTGQGFKFFSPRFSKETGKNVEYTFKVPELAEIGHPAKPVGMGEMLFWKRTPAGLLLREFSDWRGPEWLCWKYLAASEIGGILNAHAVRSRDVWPEVRVYRIDRWNSIDMYAVPFWDNRNLQISMTSYLNSDLWKVVSLAKTERNSKSERWEGFVGVPEGLSVNDGLKLKFWGDSHDWEVISNELSLSEKGNVQGVIWFRSLESGKEFKLGPGQIGSFDTCMSLLEHGDRAIGLVAKVHGRQGHEGRAAKIVDWHMDKGVLPSDFK